MQRQLKNALDENNVIASGRYEHAKPEDHTPIINLEKLISIPTDYSLEPDHKPQETTKEKAEAVF